MSTSFRCQVFSIDTAGLNNLVKILCSLSATVVPLCYFSVIKLRAIIAEMIMVNCQILVDRLLRDIRRFIPIFANMQFGALALDLCCGTGEQVIEFGKSGITATGIDIDSNILKAALKNKAKNNLENISFQQADATNLPFPDCHFDCVSISFGLHDKARMTRKKIVSEMIRVVKQNGTLIFVDFQVPLPANISGLTARTIEFLVGGEHYRNFKDYRRSGGLENLLKNQNLRKVEQVLLKNRLVTAMRIVKS
jgi:ubiquinone/menaquinone biosynthesis C-methylase UbiE